MTKRIRRPAKATAIDDLITKKVAVPISFDYKAYVGPSEKFNEIGQLQIDVLKEAGLKIYSTLLDFGCGALRGGRHFIPYLSKSKYYGIEPNKELLDMGIEYELEDGVFSKKAPTFSNENSFKLTVFKRNFDYILAQSIFTHAARNQVETILGEGFKCMTKASQFLATYFKGTSDHVGDEWVYPHRVEYKDSTMKAMVEAAGFTYEELNHPHPAGQQWIKIVKR